MKQIKSVEIIKGDFTGMSNKTGKSKKTKKRESLWKINQVRN